MHNLRFYVLKALFILGVINSNTDLTDEIIKDVAGSGGKAKILGEIEPEDDDPEDPENPEDDDPEDPENKIPPKKEEKKKPGDDTGGNGFDFKAFNEAYGVEANDIKTVIAIGSQFKARAAVEEALKAKDAELVSLRQTVADLELQVDPMAHFASQDEYRRQQLLKKFPDYDPSVLSRIMTIKDMDKADPIEILKLHRLLKDGEIYRNESEAMESIKNDFDFDPDQPLDQQEFKTRTGILKAAKDARAEFKSLGADIQIPSKEAAIAERQQKVADLTSKWEPFVGESMIKSLSKIEFKTKEGEVKFEFEVDKKFLDHIAGAKKTIAKDLAERGMQLTPEVQKVVQQEYMNFYIARNMQRIAEAYHKAEVQKMDQAAYEALHNPRPNKQGGGKTPVKTTKALSKEAAEAEIEKNLR